MKVAIIGGTGFVGGHLVDALLASGHQPWLLVRPGSERKVHRSDACRIVIGRAREDADVQRVVAGADAVVFCIGILRETAQASFAELQWRAAERAIRAARASGVQRFLLMSAIGARSDGVPYQRTKHQAEESLRSSGLAGTIFRPSVIFGDPRGADEIASRLLREMVRPPLPALAFQNGILPGRNPVQLAPVHVSDVAAAFLAALADPATIGQTCTLAGPEVLSWREVVRRIAAATGRRKLFVPMPIGVMKLAASLLDRFAWFPATRDQLTMLAEGSVASPDALQQLIGRAPQAFGSETLGYLRRQQRS